MSHTTTAEFTIRDRTARLTLNESNTGALSLSFNWTPMPPTSMDFADQEMFKDGLAEALEALIPTAFDRSDDDEDPLAAKSLGHGSLRKIDMGDDSAANMIKAAHRAGGAPLLQKKTRSKGVRQ